jgi:enoyl-CoA hydratase/carnithine racemase
MATGYVTLEKEDGVGIAWIDKPPANTYDVDMMRDLNAVIDEIRFDDDVKVAVLASKLDKFFSAGADIHMLRQSEADYKAAFCLGCQETLNKMESTPKVFLSAIRGHCVGGGLEIALATDLRFGAEGDYRIGLPEVTLGVLPGTGGTQRLPRLVGRARALDLMITGRTLSPQEAYDVGILQRLWEPKEFWDETMAYAQTLTKGAAKAVGLIKRSVVEGIEMSLLEGLALERELQNRLFVTHDAREGFAAFLEKRKAVFKGE